MSAATERHAAVNAEMRGIIGAAERADRELTGAEILRFDRLKAERDALPKRSSPPQSCAHGASLPTTPAQPLGRRLDALAAQLQSRLSGRRTARIEAPRTFVQGYAALFNKPTRPDQTGERALIKPGAFALAGSVIYLCRNHDTGHRYAGTDDGSLRLWQDAVGLAMEATIEHTSLGRRLLSIIADGSACGLSVSLSKGRTSAMATVVGEVFEVVARTTISEVSIVSSPLLPGSICWLADADPGTLPRAARALLPSWKAGRR